MPDQAPQRVTVGAAVAAFLHRCGVATAFGVISIHNMPILDALAGQGRIRFVPSRGEAGALNMADANARVSGGLGVALTSTGTAAGNAAGGMVEALTAGSPVLHLTGQIDSKYLDRHWAYIHEARDQPGMLSAVAKAAYRVTDPAEAIPVLRTAVATALTAPCGPVAVEIPIDVQAAVLPAMPDLTPYPVQRLQPSDAALDALADRLAMARRPLLWLGGGARGAEAAVERLAAMGFAVISSTQGRGVLREDHPMSLGSFTVHGPVPAFYDHCDAALVVGSHLRGNETLTYRCGLPRPLYRIDADPLADGRGYAGDGFVLGDAALALDGLADRLDGRLTADPAFADAVAATRAGAEDTVRAGLGPYDALVDAVQTAMGGRSVWVRDVTISNSTWGNRLPPLSGSRDGVHAVGGGIGQGLPMGIGAALAAGDRRTVVLTGDGGLQLCLGELATAVQERADLLLLVMNDGGYGVIRNIQDAAYGGRRAYTDLLTPDFAQIAAAVGMPYRRIDDLGAIGDALATRGPAMVEIDMAAIGPFATAFAGPPVAAVTGKAPV